MLQIAKSQIFRFNILGQIKLLNRVCNCNGLCVCSHTHTHARTVDMGRYTLSGGEWLLLNIFTQRTVKKWCIQRPNDKKTKRMSADLHHARIRINDEGCGGVVVVVVIRHVHCTILTRQHENMWNKWNLWASYCRASNILTLLLLHSISRRWNFFLLCLSVRLASTGKERQQTTTSTAMSFSFSLAAQPCRRRMLKFPQLTKNRNNFYSLLASNVVVGCVGLWRRLSKWVAISFNFHCAANIDS